MALANEQGVSANSSLLERAGELEDELGDRDYEEVLEEAGVGRFQWLSILICGLGNATDAVEVLSLSYILPELDPGSQGKGSDSHKMLEGSLSSAVFAGMLLGGLVGGGLSDRVGRKSMICASMMLNALFTLCFGIARDEQSLVFLRAMTGFGVGSGIPAVFCYVAEVVPSSFRGTAVCAVATFWMIGSIFVAVLAWLVIPGFGWHTFAMLCSLPAFCSAVLALFLLPESPRFLLAQGQIRDAEKSLSVMLSYGGKSRQGPRLQCVVPSTDAAENTGDSQASVMDLIGYELRGRTFLLSVIWMGICFGWYGMVIWIPTLMKRRHVELCWDSTLGQDSCLYQSSLLVAAAQVPGNLITTLSADLVGRNSLLAGSLLAASAAAIATANASDPSWTGVLFCVFNGVSVMSWNTLDVVSVEFFPTRLRGSAMGLLTSLGRVASAVAQWEYSMQSGSSSMAVSCVFLLAAAIATMSLPDLTAKRLVD